MICFQTSLAEGIYNVALCSGHMKGDRKLIFAEWKKRHLALMYSGIFIDWLAFSSVANAAISDGSCLITAYKPHLWSVHVPTEEVKRVDAAPKGQRCQDGFLLVNSANFHFRWIICSDLIGPADPSVSVQILTSAGVTTPTQRHTQSASCICSPHYFITSSSSFFFCTSSFRLSFTPCEASPYVSPLIHENILCDCRCLKLSSNERTECWITTCETSCTGVFLRWLSLFWSVSVGDMNWFQPQLGTGFTVEVDLSRFAFCEYHFVFCWKTIFAEIFRALH